jgi:hypothetical protein
MARDDNFPCLEVEATITTVLRWIAEKDTFSCTRGEFVSGGGECVDVTEATKDSQVLVARCMAEEGVVWCGVWVGGGWANVYKIGSCVECLGPECGWHGCLEKKSSDDIIGCANGAFGLAVLLRGVGAGEAVENAIGATEGIEIRVVKLFTIVALER